MTSHQASDDYDHLIKLLLLGDSAVGKSSLLMRYTEGKFEQNFYITIGVDFRMKTVKRGSKTLRVQVWDTAGQERFRTITPAYYRSAMGVIMVYDTTDDASFENVEYWLTNLSQHGDKAQNIILVGNKCDLESKRKVPKEHGEALAAKHGMLFFETSAKEGAGVEEAFNGVVDLVVEQRFGANAEVVDVTQGSHQVKDAAGARGKKKTCAC